MNQTKKFENLVVGISEFGSAELIVESGFAGFFSGDKPIFVASDGASRFLKNRGFDH